MAAQQLCDFSDSELYREAESLQKKHSRVLDELERREQDVRTTQPLSIFNLICRFICSVFSCG